MDWQFAINRQHTALLGILAALVAMAAGSAGALPRHLHRSILRLLRPAEAATRRLIIALARTLPVPEVRASRPRKPSLVTPTFVKNGVGTGIVLPKGYGASPVPRRQNLPLLDPLRNPWNKTRRRPQACVPRITFLGFSEPFPVAVRGPLSPDDPLDTSRLKLRLKAVAAALDDLPAAARRFARWRARRTAPDRSSQKPRRSWPLKPGRPPGWSRKPTHAVHEVLNDAHWLAWTALERRDTS